MSYQFVRYIVTTNGPNIVLDIIAVRLSEVLDNLVIGHFDFRHNIKKNILKFLLKSEKYFLKCNKDDTNMQIAIFIYFTNT